MVLAQHVFDMEHTIIRFFLDQNQAADFIEQLVEGANDNQSF
jgi:hypothetical protein